MFRLHVNGRRRAVDVPGDTPLLWALRDELGLTGPRYGCGVGACGACVSLIDGRAERPCVRTVADTEHSRVCPNTVTTRCSGPGWNSTSPSAATASPGRS